MQIQTKYSKENPLVMTPMERQALLKLHPEYEAKVQRLEAEGKIIIKSPVGKYIDQLSKVVRSNPDDTRPHYTKENPLHISQDTYAELTGGILCPEFKSGLKILMELGIIVVD